MPTQQTETAQSRKIRLLTMACLFAPVLIALSITMHDLRVTFALAAVVLALDAYVARLRGLHLVVRIALWAGALGFAATLAYLGFRSLG